MCVNIVRVKVRENGKNEPKGGRGKENGAGHVAARQVRKVNAVCEIAESMMALSSVQWLCSVCCGCSVCELK